MTSLSRILVGTGCTSLECPWHPARDALPCWTRLVRGRIIPAGGVLDGLLLRRPNTNAPRTEGHGGRSAWRRLVILRLPLSPSNSKDRSPAREGCTPLRAVLMRRLIGRPRLAWGPRRRRPAPSRKVSAQWPESNLGRRRRRVHTSDWECERAFLAGLTRGIAPVDRSIGGMSGCFRSLWLRRQPSQPTWSQSTNAPRMRDVEGVRSWCAVVRPPTPCRTRLAPTARRVGNCSSALRDHIPVGNTRWWRRRRGSRRAE